MILIDTNLLLYAHSPESPQNPRAKTWFYEQLNSEVRVGLPWHSLLGFIRLSSKRGFFTTPIPVTDGWRQVLQWLALDNVWVPNPTPRHNDMLDELFQTVGISSGSVMDIHLAALAIEHGLTLCSADLGFARYKKLRWMNPLDA